MWYKKGLIEVVKNSGCIREGTFILKSGITTKTYFDCRKIFLDSQYLSAIIPAYIEELRNIVNENTVLCGIPTSGLILLGGILHRLAIHREVRACYPRSEIKNHGLKKRFEGNIDSNSELIILDDVVTSGQTILNTIEVFKGYRIKHVLVFIDRSEDFRNSLKQMDINFKSLLTMDEII